MHTIKVTTANNEKIIPLLLYFCKKLSVKKDAKDETHKKQKNNNTSIYKLTLPTLISSNKRLNTAPGRSLVQKPKEKSTAYIE